VYYVGQQGPASDLIVTRQGDIPHQQQSRQLFPQYENRETLGFKFSDREGFA